MNKEQTVITTAIFPARYVQGSHAIRFLGEELSRLGHKALVIMGPVIFPQLQPIVEEFTEGKIEIYLERFGGECCDPEIEQMVSLGKTQEVDLIVGIGGGKTIDTAKATAYQLKLPVAIVPTIASTDAPCSALSVIYTPEGVWERYLVLPRNPDLVLVDTDIIAQAPVRFLVAGMGDALATWFEAEDCQIKRAKNMTGRMGPMTAFSLAHLCYETLLEYGVYGKIACEQQVVTPALERIIEANTLLSGLGFESGGLAAAHAIHNGFTVLEETKKFWHGEKVAFGVLAMLILTDRPSPVIDRVFSFCESIGLPTTLADIGLEGVSRDRLLLAAERACSTGETIHNEPCEISPETVLAAMLAADAQGRRRKQF
ncbi:glycerol dehydrogenase [Planktothrix agardhii]|uniref:glycerol dehydrogenase n=1 Tax=Planktothrix agardhii TaxID=1160 RepID=UPI001F287184|nr:glycerol dehydrogenase [Planktothrix agardhii]MCB8751936.1 glycerol dehydrogenase [Planktothrix agardhii 1810]MCF3567524.1 glycerol dehydrogenase [Planktothrix agardhii 1807]MCP9296085.1 glycerol dehydrogenase [Planktothrix agardhii LY1]